MVVEHVVLAFVDDKADGIVDPAFGSCVMKLRTISFGECTLDFVGIILYEHNPTEDQKNEGTVKYCLFHIDTHACTEDARPSRDWSSEG